MALAAIQRAKKERARNTSPVPERNCRLLLSTDSLSFDTPLEISGKLCLDNTATDSILLSGILVRFEINAVIRFGTRFDGRTTSHSKVDNVLADADWARVYVFGEDTLGSSLVLPTGRLEWAFCLRAPEDLNRLPGTLKSAHGSVVYQVAAYLQRSFPEVPDRPYFNKLIASPALSSAGHFNLALHPAALAPIHLEKAVQKSFFSKKSAYTGCLEVEKTGFLPSEPLPFAIRLRSEGGETLTRLALSLVRRLCFRTETQTKTASTILASKSLKAPAREGDEEVVWTDALALPLPLTPSTTGPISTTYLLRLEIECAERVPVKAEVEILVGTTWGDAERDAALRPALLKQSSTPRQSSTDSTASAPPPRQSSTDSAPDSQAPPNYSQLSSRQDSLETLPPGYEEEELGLGSLELDQ